MAAADELEETSGTEVVRRRRTQTERLWIEELPSTPTDALKGQVTQIDSCAGL